MRRAVIPAALACLIFNTVALAQGNAVGSKPRSATTPNIIRARQEWFFKQRAYPVRQIPAGARLRALRQLRRMEAARPPSGRALHERAGGKLSSASQTEALSSTQWTLIGPQPTSTSEPYNPVSGRVTALAVDPTNPDIVYLGSAEGGVWKTTDGGQHWTPLTDSQPSLAIGSIAIDPNSCSPGPCTTIYAGTGEENFNNDAYFGAGILKSTDGGATWTQVAGPFVGPVGSDQSEGGAYIGSIAVDPANSQIVLAGVELDAVPESGGIFRSSDGGQTWAEVFNQTRATQVLFDPTNANIAYAAVVNFGVYRSSDAGLTWVYDDGVDPNGPTTLPETGVGRFSIALDPHSAGTLYAGVATGPLGLDGTLGGFDGLYKTTDSGAHWTQLTAVPNYCAPSGGNPQCDYDNVVAVDPVSSAVFIGGSAEQASPSSPYVAMVWRSLDSGANWTDLNLGGANSGPQAVHPDVHAIAFAADGSKMYVGTDGGVWSTANVTTAPVTWNDLNETLALTQFYPGMSILPYDASDGAGGTQDNGSQGYAGQMEWQSFPPCGDGGWTSVVGQVEPSVFYWSCIFGQGVWEYDNAAQTVASIQPTGSASDVSDFVPPLVSDPSNSQTLYFGTDKIYQSIDGGTNWNALVQLTSSSAYFTSVAVAPTNSAIVYAGASDGTVTATFNASAGTGATWFDVSTNNGLPTRWVTQVAADPHDPLTVYATFSGFSGFTDNLGHVFESPDGSTGWNDISGNLPNIPVNDIVVDPDVPNTLYVATDIGVFMTSDGGTTWTPINGGLPNVAVLSLKLNEASRILRAGTHGRSAWDLFVPANLPVASFSTPTVSFGPQLINTTSASQTVMLTDTGAVAMNINGASISGANAADFSESNDCPATLAAGANCTVTLSFTPSLDASESATLQVADGAPASPQLVYLSGQGANPAVSFSATTLNFGSQPVNTASAVQMVTLVVSQDPLTITGISLSGADSSDFSETNTCGSSVPLGSSCMISVTFAPAAGGARSATVAIADDAPASPQMISLTGTGVPPTVTLSATALTFSSQNVGTASAEQTLTLTNNGPGPLTVTSASATGDFAVASNTCLGTISASATCSIGVSFTPTSPGTLSGMLTVTDDAGGSPQAVALSGTGTGPVASVSPSSLSFSAQIAGSASAAQTLTVKNTGNANLTVSGLGISGADAGDFAIAAAGTTCTAGGSVAAGASCVIAVTFTPSAGGSRAGTLNVTDNSGNTSGSVQNVPLVGTGEDFTLGVASGSSSSATVSLGGSASYSLAVGSQGAFTGAVALSCSGAPSEATCTVSPRSVPLDGTNSQNVTVTVTTTAASAAPPAPMGGPPVSHWPVALWIAMLAMVGSFGLAGTRREEPHSPKNRAVRITALATTLLFVALWAACGGGGGGSGPTPPSNPGTPAGTYTLSVTGTAASLSHSLQLTLTVQ